MCSKNIEHGQNIFELADKIGSSEKLKPNTSAFSNPTMTVLR